MQIFSARKSIQLINALIMNFIWNSIEYCNWKIVEIKAWNLWRFFVCNGYDSTLNNAINYINLPFTMKTNRTYKSFTKKENRLLFFKWFIGSWTYGGLEVDLQHRDSHIERAETERLLGFDGEYDETVWIVDEGCVFYISTEFLKLKS